MITITAMTGSVPGSLCDHAAATGAGLMVVATHGRTGLSRWLLGSVSERLLRAAPCPVLIARGGSAQEVPPLRRLLVAVDLSEHSRTALHVAGAIAAQFAAVLDVLYVWAAPFYDADEHIMDFRRIERLANERRISLRTGCFCNPGAGEVANALSAAEMASCFISKERMTFEQFLAVMDGKASGAVRVSLGVASNFADVFSFAAFAPSLVDRRAEEI